MRIADVDLRYRAAAGLFHHQRALLRIEIDADLLDVVDALGEEGRDERGRRAAVGPDGAPVDDAGAEALALGEAVLLDERGRGVLVGRAGHAEEVERDGRDGELDGPRVGLCLVLRGEGGLNGWN